MAKIALIASCLTLLVGLVSAGYDGHYAYPSYSYKYGVESPHTGDVKNQWESRDGGVVKGGYSLVEPDGNVRVVEYVASPHGGFNAVVKHLKHSVHPVGHGFYHG